MHYIIIIIIIVPSLLAPPFLNCSTTLHQASPGLQHCKVHMCLCVCVYVNASKGKSKWVPHHLPPLLLHFPLHPASSNFISSSTTRPRQPLYSDCAPYNGATCQSVCVCEFVEMENIIFHKF